MWAEPFESEDQYPSGQPGERVLVVVVARPTDWERVRSEQWYRIPLSRAPKRVAAEYLAFYHTSRFPQLRWTISCYAPVQRYSVAPRRELLPHEPDHPRAQELYYKVELGPLQQLPRPIPSLKLRRVTFILTTLSHLLAATEINDLWLRDNARDRLQQLLRAREVEAYPDYTIREHGWVYTADLAIFCRRAKLAIECLAASAGPSSQGSGAVSNDLGDRLAQRGWLLQQLEAERILSDGLRCAQLVADLVATHGGPARRSPDSAAADEARGDGER